MKRIRLAFKKWFFDYFYYRNVVRKTGLTFKEYCIFIFQANDGGSKLTTSVIFGKEFLRTNTFWHVQNVLEIFIDEVYYFNSSNDAPFIIDCGANYGLSIIYLKKLFPKATVLAFEADKNIADVCKKNISMHGLADVQVINNAVWTKEEVLFFKSDGMQGGRLTSREELSNQGVKAIRLRKYLNRKVDFLKIDIEGAELEVIKDCSDNLSFVENLFVEYHSDSQEGQRLSELLLILENAGFRYYIKEAYRTMTYPFKDFNSIKEGFDLQLNIFAYRK